MRLSTAVESLGNLSADSRPKRGCESSCSLVERALPRQAINGFYEPARTRENNRPPSGSGSFLASSCCINPPDERCAAANDSARTMPP